MSNGRITMQDIADACGLSRNTVSKAFNGRGAVPPATRALIMQKAQELGYRIPMAGQAPQAPQFPPAGESIALLTYQMPRDFHFGTVFLTSFTDQISRAGYTLKIFEISREELLEQRLPPHFILSQTAGILGIELFDEAYLRMVCGLGLPALMVDGPAQAGLELMPCDYVLMENVASVYAVVRRLHASGARRIGFAGDPEHCRSFHERWVGFQLALQSLGLPYDESLCILDPDSSPYSDRNWMAARLRSMPLIPEAFVCTNDYLAIHLMNALKGMGISIPGRVQVAGFDGTSQSALVEPSLTTVQIPSTEIGSIAADMLISRIRRPEKPFVWTHVKTTPVWRNSTRDPETF